ncbi:hypothetical protein PBY51_019447 [Eleginops maclovinus]|uniref:Uncharacterized protein n=1 Tax=Eleginops maclovinus TaxID=56733 RepID=A0AAN8AYR1_ELEMC|nr:hypothetical protein PBY51_019447 [Eleginops maclovinus]
MCLCSLLEHSSGSNEGEKRHREETATGEKCEPLALVAAQSQRLPMWKRPGCEFPTEMGSVQRECKPISSLLSYLGTAAASICQLFMVAT